MKEVLISIRPKWTALIASGRKTVELRKSLPFWSGRMWVYETAPVKRIGGWMDVAKVDWLRVSDLWKAVKDKACVERQDFDAYYGSRALGCCAWIREWHPLPEPVSLEAVGLKRPPQNWQWIDRDAVLEAAGIFVPEAKNLEDFC